MASIKEIINRNILLSKTKFFYLNNYKDKSVKILDIGVQNNSIKQAKTFFVKSKYYGLDIEKFFSDRDMSLMEDFFQVDLEAGSLEFLDDDFDIVIINHVLEHVNNGINVVDTLAKKIKKGGSMYIEYPNINSLSDTQSWRYHFHYDSTHKKIYFLEDIVNILMKNGFNILSSGKVDTKIKSIFLIPRIFMQLFRRDPLGSLFPHYENKITHVLASKI